MSPTRPALRWHGGKWKLAPWVISHFPAHRIYVEPFGGAASVLIRKPRSYAEVYNDLDSEVVTLFRCLRDPLSAEKLRGALEKTPFARDELSAAYESTDDPIEKSRRLIVRSFMGFASGAHATGNKTGFRANSNRSGTTPARDWVNWPSQIERFVERLAGVVIENRDAIEIIKQHDTPGTLIYADPPYVHSTRTRTNEGVSQKYAHEMSTEDHCRLAELLRSVSGMVVISGYPCDLYDRDLYPDWERIERKALADGARERTEVLWLNDAAATRMGAHTATLFTQAEARA